MWSGVTNGGQKEGTKGTYWRRKEDQEWYDSEGKKGKRRRCSGVGNESELRPGSSGASLQTVLELCSSGTTVGSHVGRMPTMTGRDEGDADEAEWRDERSNRRSKWTSLVGHVRSPSGANKTGPSSAKVAQVAKEEMEHAANLAVQIDLHKHMYT